MIQGARIAYTRGERSSEAAVRGLARASFERVPAALGTWRCAAGQARPKTALSDEELVVEIRTVLSERSVRGRGAPEGACPPGGEGDPGLGLPA